jgi:hypothetical protein
MPRIQCVPVLRSSFNENRRFPSTSYRTRILGNDHHQFRIERLMEYLKQETKRWAIANGDEHQYSD